jgi:hypothetical protein
MVAGKQRERQIKKPMNPSSVPIWVDLKIDVFLAPKGQSGEPILALDRLACLGPLFWRQNARRCGEFWAGYFAADGAGSDFHVRTIANPLVLSGVAAGHNVKFSVLLGKPHCRLDRCSGLAECDEHDVILTADLKWNWHRFYSLGMRATGVSQSKRTHSRIARKPPNMLKASHAQMDARPLEASQKRT